MAPSYAWYCPGLTNGRSIRVFIQPDIFRTLAIFVTDLLKMKPACRCLVPRIRFSTFSVG